MTNDFILLYLVLINAIAVLLMLVDKIKATKRAWRIPESTLIGVAVVGGSIGALIGMYTFRHKTKHIKFTLGLPLILVMQVFITIWLMV